MNRYMDRDELILYVAIAAARCTDISATNKDLVDVVPSIADTYDNLVVGEWDRVMGGWELGLFVQAVLRAIDNDRIAQRGLRNSYEFRRKLVTKLWDSCHQGRQI
jgi:hypothetical protein